jgi:DNA-binding MarR family transcriptional regulator
MRAPTTDTAIIASELRGVLGRLVRRLRAEHRLPLSQGAVLAHLDREGPASVSALAAREGVRPQSMAQTVADLQGAGFLDRRPDPSDGRRQLAELTPEGAEALQADRRLREGWLAGAIAERLSAGEREVLHQAVGLLRRLTEA